ncbi:MAG: hypothetical protein ACLU37_05800 [Collinsella sp.]
MPEAATNFISEHKMGLKDEGLGASPAMPSATPAVLRLTVAITTLCS